MFIKLTRTTTEDPGFQHLIRQLDEDLWRRYGDVQAEYAPHNVMPLLETVVLAYAEDKPVACGCFKPFDATTVEVKRMFVEPAHRGRGISRQVLRELERWARELGYQRMVLETGDKQEEAIGLYESTGYTQTEKFGPYRDLPASICYEKKLTGINGT